MRRPKDKLNPIPFRYTQHTQHTRSLSPCVLSNDRFSMFVQLVFIRFASLMLLSHLPIAKGHDHKHNSILVCTTNANCVYDFPLDNHFQCQIIQFIRICVANKQWLAPIGHMLTLPNTVATCTHTHSLSFGSFLPSMHKIQFDWMKIHLLYAIHHIQFVFDSYPDSTWLFCHICGLATESQQFNLRFVAHLETNLYIN